MHRKPIHHSWYQLLAILSAVTLAWMAYTLRHPLVDAFHVEARGILTVWNNVHPHAEFGRTGWLAFGNRNPLINWDLHWHGTHIGAWGHRVGYGWYGTLIFPHHSPNGGMYIELFGHAYGWELWGRFGSFSGPTS